MRLHQLAGPAVALLIALTIVAATAEGSGGSGEFADGGQPLADAFDAVQQRSDAAADAFALAASPEMTDARHHSAPAR